MIEMNTRIYLRASTKDQDAERALQILQDLNQNLNRNGFVGDQLS